MDKGHYIKNPAGQVIPECKLPGKKIPLILVTGFLGSGKTTFIANILKNTDRNLKIALVQNEYAASGIDTLYLRETGRDFSIMEVYQGSVFCVCLLGSFIPSLCSFLDKQEADMLILESTGLADPIAIAEILTDPGLASRIFLSSVFCLVDAVNYTKINKVNQIIRRQIQIADYILVNKTDLTQGSEEDIIPELEKLNNLADIQKVSYGKLKEIESAVYLPKPVALLQAIKHSELKPAGRPDISTLVLKTSHAVSRTALEHFLSDLSPDLIRVKGYLLLSDSHPMEIQYVSGKTGMTEKKDYSGQTELVGLGWNIDNREFGRKYHDLRKRYPADDFQ